LLVVEVVLAGKCHPQLVALGQFLDHVISRLNFLQSLFQWPDFPQYKQTLDWSTWEDDASFPLPVGEENLPFTLP
jgi:hypothetical protein